jgi:acetyl-CoA acetyltransferase
MAGLSATQIGLLPQKNVLVRTIDTGGAGPISALLEADEMIRHEGCDLVAVVAGDAVSSLDSKEFLRRADAGVSSPNNTLPSPLIPNSYDKIARWQMETYGGPLTSIHSLCHDMPLSVSVSLSLSVIVSVSLVSLSFQVTREQLAMTAVLMSYQACHHPLALTKKPLTLSQVLSSPSIAPCTSLLECARRADGGAAILVASSRFLAKMGLDDQKAPIIVGGGEASGPLYPPDLITEDMFSCEEAAYAAYVLMAPVCLCLSISLSLSLSLSLDLLASRSVGILRRN